MFCVVEIVKEELQMNSAISRRYLLFIIPTYHLLHKSE